MPRPGAPASGGPDTGGGMSSREEERWGLARAAALRDAGPGGARRGNNALTALFLQALAEVAHGEGRPNRVSNLQRAAQGVLASPRELVDQEGLLQIHQLGLATAREIERGLWRACGPPAVYDSFKILRQERVADNILPALSSGSLPEYSGYTGIHTLLFLPL